MAADPRDEGLFLKSLWPIFWGCANVAVLVLWLALPGKAGGGTFLIYYVMIMMILYGSETSGIIEGIDRKVDWSRIFIKGLLAITVLWFLGWYLFDRPGAPGILGLYKYYSIAVLVLVAAELAVKRIRSAREKKPKGTGDEIHGQGRPQTPG